MILISSMVMEQQLTEAVEQPWWVNSGILAVVNKYVWKLDYFMECIFQVSKIIDCRLERHFDMI